MLTKKNAGQKYLTKMNSTVDSMGTLIESLVLLSRLDQIELETSQVQISEVLLTCREIHHPKVVFTYDSTTASIHKHLFVLAIDNIIGNAIKFTPAD